MATSLQKPIDGFLRLIEKDREFFKYYSLSEQAAMALAYDRSRQYLNEAIAMIVMNCQPEAGIFDIDEETGCLSGDLTLSETLLISSLMFEMYLERDISKLKMMNVNFTATDLRVFDPSNARSTFMTMYESVRQQNRDLMDAYRNTDRLTGKFKGINFASYEEE